MLLPDLSTFDEIVFPRDSEIIYVLCAISANPKHQVPFYVGQSGRSFGRIGDYQAAKFTAPTDFKVGTVVRMLRARRIEVVVRYKASSSRRGDEAHLLAEYKAMNVPLLNFVKGYNYKKATAEAESEQLQAFVNELAQRVAASASDA